MLHVQVQVVAEESVCVVCMVFSTWDLEDMSQKMLCSKQKERATNKNLPRPTNLFKDHHCECASPTVHFSENHSLCTLYKCSCDCLCIIVQHTQCASDNPRHIPNCRVSHETLNLIHSTVSHSFASADVLVTSERHGDDNGQLSKR